MRAASSILFWGCFGVIAWVYWGYPLALKIGVFGRPGRPALFDAGVFFWPPISVIIPARNEEAGIEAKLRNVLDSAYPRERLEILVGSDGSSDRTQEIVERFRDAGVGLVSFPQHRGKSAIQNGLAALASGSILVFTDADCLLPRDALRNMVRHFADPAVGLVTGTPRYRHADATATVANEGAYLRYETWLRQLESERGLLAMASGSLFAMRRSLWRPLAADCSDDFALPLEVARIGLRCVLESRACPVTELPQNNPEAMLRMKVRVISKDFRTLLEHRDLLNPLRHAALAASLGSHKLLRWLVPFFLLVLFASNLFLLEGAIYRVALALQSMFYALAAGGLIAEGKLRAHIWSVPMSFCVVNCAAALGIWKTLAGRPSGVWEPERTSPAAARSERGRMPAD